MKYDVFISYSSKDCQWAEELEKKLTQRGLEVFRDKDRLIPGKEWEEQLLAALENSQHMIVLWSENARNSDWVTKEAGYFDVKYRLDKNKSLFIIVLNDDPRAYASLQTIHDVKESNLYQLGVAAMSNELWDKILNNIQKGMGGDDARKPIWRLTFALTYDEISRLDFDERLEGVGESLNTLFALAGVQKDDIINRYGPKRNDWKPFGGTKNVIQILNELLNNINAKYSLTYRWREPDEESIYSTERIKIERELQKMTESLSVIVIDPISLYHPAIARRFRMCSHLFKSKNVSIIPLSSFEYASNFLAWRKILENSATDLYNYYFEPPIPKNQLLAQFNANPVDEHDARRLIQSIVSEDASEGGRSKPGELRF